MNIRNHNYATVLVIGGTTIVLQILKYVALLRTEYNYAVEFIAYSGNQISMTDVQKTCIDNKVDIKEYGTKQDVKTYLLTKEEKILIISAGNNYLFPREIVENSNITIINFHNTLLPKYPGRNGTTWPIFYGETESGATWHFANKHVDAGDIIWQKKCSISRDTKAYELARDIMKIAFEGFQQIFPEVLEGKTEIIQPALSVEDIGRQIFYSYEIPNGGRFNLDDSPEDIYKLLRCTDYGPFNTFPRMKTYLPNGQDIAIKTYRRRRICYESYKRLRIDKQNRKIFIAMDDSCELVMKYDEL